MDTLLNIKVKNWPW